jgi:hypothetical protein
VVLPRLIPIRSHRGVPHLAEWVVHNSLHFPDDSAARAQTVSTVDIGQLKLAIGDAVAAQINFALSTIAL